MKQTSISNLKTKTVVNDNDYLIIDDLSSTNKILFKTILDTCKQKLLDELYPIGSIYMSVNSANPSTLFGGTWEKIKDRFLLASGDTYTAGDMGGESTHTLTSEEMPEHNHGYNSYQNGYPSNHIDDTNYRTPVQRIPWSGNVTENTYSSKAGSSQAHNNMPPYLVVNIWKRTA